LVLTQSGETFSYNFKYPGEVVLKALFSYSGCNLSLKKNVKIYKQVILTVDVKNNFLSSLPLDKKKCFNL